MCEITARIWFDNLTIASFNEKIHSKYMQIPPPGSEYKQCLLPQCGYIQVINKSRV